MVKFCETVLIFTYVLTDNELEYKKISYFNTSIMTKMYRDEIKEEGCIIEDLFDEEFVWRGIKKSLETYMGGYPKL